MIKRHKTKWILLLLLIVSVVISAVNYTVTVYSVGDSTMANFSLTTDLRRGWMQNMPPFFNSEVKIINYAKSGRSSKSFIDEGHWNTTISHVDSGDYVIIQIGHNDEKDDTTRHTDPWTTYTDNFRKFVTETRQKGGIPILCTSIVRRSFNNDGTVQNTHSEYPDAVRKLAADSSVTLVDMTILTRELVESFGPDSSKLLYNYVEPGVSDLYPEGNEDDTHLNNLGATKVAELFVDGLKELEHPLTAFLNTTAVDRKESLHIPDNNRHLQNYPNPFKPLTTIENSIKDPGRVKVVIFNVLGEIVKTLLDKKQAAGNYQVN